MSNMRVSAWHVLTAELLLLPFFTRFRYTIRVQAADDAGGWTSQDVQLLVRKAGDVSGRAPCCRSTGLIIAQQLGRPIDSAVFRPAWINASAAAVGWDAGYLSGPEDLEAERLFDYSLLAPLDTGVCACGTQPDSNRKLLRTAVCVCFSQRLTRLSSSTTTSDCLFPIAALQASCKT